MLGGLLLDFKTEAKKIYEAPSVQALLKLNERFQVFSESQLNALKETSEFDEEWEIVLFRLAQQETFLSARSFQISQLLNFIAELVPANEDFGNFISRVIGFSVVTSVSLDFVPKMSKKGNRVRFDDWDSYTSMLSESKSLEPLIPTLELIRDYFIQTFPNEIQINFTPNFMTIAVKNPIGRARTVVFIRLTNKGYVQFEYAGKTVQVTRSTDFTDEMKNEIQIRFNELSLNKIL